MIPQFAASGTCDPATRTEYAGCFNREQPERKYLWMDGVAIALKLIRFPGLGCRTQVGPVKQPRQV